MKLKVNKYLFVIVLLSILLLPSFANAEEEREIVSQDIKYYKTVTHKNLFTTYGVEQQDNVVTYEISKEEYDNFNPATANNSRSAQAVETTYKYMLTTLYKSGDYFFVENFLSWKNFPATRSYDIIGIGFSGGLRPATQLQFVQHYCTASGSCVNQTNGNPFISTYGAASLFALPTVELSRLNQTFSFYLGKVNSGTVTGFDVYGDYAHAQRSVTFSEASQFEMDYNNIEFFNSSVASKFDDITSTALSWSGTW